MTNGLDGNKIIYINQLSSVQFKNPGNFTNGYIQFIFQGSQENKGGVFAAASDENTVLFNHKQLSDFVKLKEHIDCILRGRSTGVQVVNNLSAADEISKFLELKNQGVISEDEFEKKKKELLGM